MLNTLKNRQPGRSMRSSAIKAAILCALASLAGPVAADVRIKDIATVEGVRENQLVGYGLVVGLNGTGDSLRNSPFTEKSIEGMLERLGVGNLSEDKIGDDDDELRLRVGGVSCRAVIITSMNRGSQSAAFQSTG